MRRVIDRVQPGLEVRRSDRPAVQTARSTEALRQIAGFVGNRAFTRMLQRDGGSEQATPAMLADDDAKVLSPGQVRKSEFLAYLREAVVEVADEVLGPAGLSPETCPYIPAWFGHYSGKDAGHVERAIRLYAPGATADRDWRSAASRVVDRVRQALQAYVATGSLAGVPAEVAKTPVIGPGGRPVDPTVQRCGLKEPKAKGGKGKGGKEQEVDFEAMYQAGEPWVGKQYAVRRLHRDHPTNPFGEHIVVKQCPSQEQQLTQRLSKHPNFPRYITSGGIYLVTAYIGDYDADPLIGGQHLGAEDLDQLEAIVKALTKEGVAHQDADNNILKDGGRLVCIDLNCKGLGSPALNVNATLSYVTRLLGKEEGEELTRRCKEFALASSK